MPPLPNINAVKLEFTYGNEGADATNIFYFAYAGSVPSVETLAGLATEMHTALDPPFIGASVASVAGLSQKYTDLSSDTGAVYVDDDGWEGTLTGDVVSANNAVVVSHTIQRRYRGGHPRTYMMVGSSTVLSGSSTKDWQASFLTNIENGFNTFLDSFPLTISGTSFTVANVSYWETVAGVRVLRETPLIDTVVGFVTRQRVCSQRRRLGKVGG